MKVLFLWALLISINCVQKSAQDCRVLADCDDGRAQWKNLSRGARGAPGKRGATGTTGPKGEPGLGVNITEVKLYLKNENRGPRRFHYTSHLTWDSSKAFCEQFDRTLCTFDQICIPNNGGRELVGDVIPGDHWVAILDTHNDWVQIGTHHSVIVVKKFKY